MPRPADGSYRLRLSIPPFPVVFVTVAVGPNGMTSPEYGLWPYSAGQDVFVSGPTTGLECHGDGTGTLLHATPSGVVSIPVSCVLV